MNFKPGKLKIIIAIIVFVLVDLLLSASVICTSQQCVTGRPCGGCPPFYTWMDDPVPITIGIMAAIIAYVIISILQKKKASKNK